MPDRPIVVGVDGTALRTVERCGIHAAPYLAQPRASHGLRRSPRPVPVVVTAAPVAPSTRRAAGLVVAGSAVPGWARRWCDERRQSVIARPDDAVAVGCATGYSVLIPRADPPAAERPRVAAAVRSLPDDAAVLAVALDAAAHLGGVLTVLHGVPLSFGERTVGGADAIRRGSDVLEQARAEAAELDVPTEVALIRAWPHEIVGERLDADLLVLGGPRTGSRGGIGLVAASAAQHAPCAVLLAPRPYAPPRDTGTVPAAFRSPTTRQEHLR